MAEPKNLTLDLDTGPRGDQKPAARIAVGETWGFTRHGGAAVVTRNCTSVAALEREVARLEEELREALAEAREKLGGGRPAATEPAATGASPSAQPIAALDTRLRVRDVMTREVRTLGPNDRLELADELMKQGRFRHVVVVEDGAVVGVLSQRDIFHGALGWSLGLGRKAHEQVLASTPAKDVMATQVVTVDPDAPLAEAAALLRDHRIGCLPVVAGDALQGILTEGDFLALLVRRS